MFFTMLRRPRSALEMKIVFDFRKAREKNSATICGCIDKQQYEWGAQRSGVPAEQVRQAVEKWMIVRPLPYLSACRFNGVTKLFADLKAAGISTGIFSDYPADQKLRALGLEADVTLSAVDAEVDCFKPAPKGLRVIAEKLHVPLEECLFVGDRDDKDGECARRAGMPYLILKKPGRYFARSGLADLTAIWRKSCKK